MNVKGRLLNLGLLLVSIATTAVLVEGGLRLGGYQSQLPYVNYLGRQQVRETLPGLFYLYPSHASFGQVWPGNPRGYFDPETNGITYEVNNYGFRDADFSLERNGRTRIAFLGDSFCWGNGVREEDTLASVLERRLNAAAPEPGFEVYSFCLAGYGSEHEAALYEQVVRHFRPDVLVVWYFLNDVNQPPHLFFNWELQAAGGWLQQARREWRLLDLAVAPLNRFKNHRKLVAATEAAYEDGHPGHASLVRALARMHHVNEEDGVRGFLAIFPWLYRLDMDRYPFQKAHRVVRTLAEKEGFTVLDLLPIFAGTPTEDLWVYPTDHHPNEIGHARAAAALFELLRSELDDGRLAAGNRRQAPPPPAREGPWWMRFAAAPNP